MILRIDRLAIELPMPAHPSPNSASAVQELLGGKFGEMWAIWTGTHPEDGSELRVVDGPPEGGPVPIHPAEPQLTSPIGPDGIDAGLFNDIASRLFGKGATQAS